jgi:ABC-type amino acid transport substrate-binding protein
MVKVIGSIVGLLVLALAGYFVDPNFKAQVNGMMGKKAPEMVTKGSDRNPEAKVAVQEGGRLAAIQESGTVTVSVQNPSKPFYSSDGGRAKGFNVDFMKILFDQSEFKGKIKVEASAVETYADVPKQLLDNKKVDIAIDGLTFNDEDLNGVVYTIPYVKDFGYSLIMAKGDSPGAGMRIGVLQGDPDAMAAAESAFPDAKIVEVSDKADASGKWIVGHIKSKRVDAVMYDYPFAVAEVEGTDLQFAITKIKGTDIKYSIGVRKGDKDLLTALNAAIRKAMDTPEYPEMLKTYFMSNSVAAVRRASSGEVSYIVAKGDTLSTIAQAQLGDIKRYTDIQSRNNLANPNFIAVGQKLVMPAK